MITRRLTLAALTAVTLLSGSPAARAQRRPEPAGIILEIKGQVLMRPTGATEPVTLDPRRDAARAVYPGERFRCARGARLRLRLGGEVKVLNGPSPWFAVRQGGPEADHFTESMREYRRTGGRSRDVPLGGLPSVLSPVNSSAVAPANFVIRWEPRPQVKRLTLAIEDGRGAELWRQENVDAAAGVLASEGARRALALYRDKGGQGPLVLRWRDEAVNNLKVVFGVLSPEEERAMEADLARWDAEPEPLVRHLGRAAVYRANWMLPQAADEYEAALSAAPESHDLLVRTVRAQRESGNFARAEELERRLPPRARRD